MRRVRFRVHVELNVTREFQPFQEIVVQCSLNPRSSGFRMPRMQLRLVLDTKPEDLPGEGLRYVHFVIRVSSSYSVIVSHAERIAWIGNERDMVMFQLKQCLIVTPC